MPRTTNMEAIAVQYIYNINHEERWEPFKHNIGPRIKYLRERMGYGKSELSKKAGIDRSSLERFESEEAIPRGTTLYKILTALYCDVVMFTRVEDIEEFKTQAENKLKEAKNAYDFRNELEAQLNKTLTYYIGGESRIVPYEIMNVLKSNIYAALEVLDTLPHDKEQN